MLHVLNTTIIPSAPGSWSVEVQPITLAAARALVAHLPYQSHVGHESTAQIMSTLLEVPVVLDRTPLILPTEETRDAATGCYVAGSRRVVALVLQLRGRAPEGRILTSEEVEAIGYDVRLMTFQPSDRPAIRLSGPLSPFAYLAEQGVMPTRPAELDADTSDGALGLLRDGSIGFARQGASGCCGSTMEAAGLFDR